MREIEDLPLIVDLDGTLTLTDTLTESVIQAVKNNPLNLFKLPLWLLKGRAAFKETIASHVDFCAKHLPYRASLLDYLVAEKQRGRKIILATAAHHSIAERVATHLDLFDSILATGHDTNLKGQVKREKIRELIGERFVYVGDSKADLPVWEASQGAILAGASASLTSSVRNRIHIIEREFPNARANLTVWLKALRAHQWLKNLLLFVPLITAFSFFDLGKLATLTLAFVSMSLCASSTYIANDLWDLSNDRSHPRKKARPFASGALSIMSGIRCATVLLAISLVLAWAASPVFAAMLVLYLMLTTVYSWFLKTRVLVDVIMLSLLYTLRIVAGALVVDIRISHWLLTFSVFTFLSLALVKRCSELVCLRQNGKTVTSGRDYQIGDLQVLWPLGIGASLAAVIVFGLFINAPETMAHYASPALLWFVEIGLIYLFAHLWITTGRGAMHDDPLVYLIESTGSLLTLLIMTLIMMAAHFLHLA